MTYTELQAKVKERLIGTDIYDLHQSPDFQCDQTDGFPTMLFACFEKGVAWLEPYYDMALDDTDIAPVEQGCADFGIRSCYDSDDYNKLLRELGEDAYQTAYLPDEEEGQALC